MHSSQGVVSAAKQLESRKKGNEQILLGDHGPVVRLRCLELTKTLSQNISCPVILSRPDQIGAHSPLQYCRPFRPILAVVLGPIKPVVSRLLLETYRIQKVVRRCNAVGEVLGTPRLFAKVARLILGKDLIRLPQLHDSILNPAHSRQRLALVRRELSFKVDLDAQWLGWNGCDCHSVDVQKIEEVVIAAGFDEIATIQLVRPRVIPCTSAYRWHALFRRQYSGNAENVGLASFSLRKESFKLSTCGR